APASNSAEKPGGDAKPAAAADTTAAPAGQVAQPIGGDAKPAASTDADKPVQPAKSAAEDKPAEGKPADAKPGGAAVTSAPAPASPQAAPPAATAAAPAAPAGLGPDAAIAEQPRQLGHGKFDRIIGGKHDRTPIEAFYSSRNYAPLWIAHP